MGRREWRRAAISRSALTFIFVTAVINSIGFGVMLPVLPDLIMEITGEGLSAAARYGGWLAVSYAVMQFLFSPAIGNLSDRFGRRPVLLLSLFLMGLNYIFMALAGTLAVLFAGRIISGIGSSTNSTLNAYIADTIVVEKRAEFFGYMGAAFGIGFIIGPVIGGLLGGIDPRLPFYAAGGLSIANMVFGFFLLPESLPQEHRRDFKLSRANPVGTLFSLWKYPVVIGIVLVIFLFQLAMSVMPNIWSFFVIEKFNWTPLEVGYSFGFIGVLMVFVQTLVIRWILPRAGLRWTGIIGFITMIAALIGYATASASWMLYVAMLAGALGQLCGPATQGIATSQVPGNQQGELQGGIASALALTAVFGPIAMTQTFAFFTGPDAPIYFPGAAFALSGVIAFVAMVLFVRVTATRQ